MSLIEDLDALADRYDWEANTSHGGAADAYQDAAIMLRQLLDTQQRRLDALLAPPPAPPPPGNNPTQQRTH